MTAHSSTPGTTPGAPSVGGQVEGVGPLASSIDRSLLQDQVRETLKKLRDACEPVVRVSERMKPYKHHYRSWLRYAFDAYEYIITGIGEDYVTEYVAKHVMNMNVEELEDILLDSYFDEHHLQAKLKSMERVIVTCDKMQKLLDFMPIKDSLEEVERQIKLDGNNYVLAFLDELGFREMTLKEFTFYGDDVFDTMKKYGYCEFARDLYMVLNYHSRFSEALREELRALAAEVLRTTESQVEKLVNPGRPIVYLPSLSH